MLSISNEFSRSLQNNGSLLVKSELTLANGKTVSLTGDDFAALSMEQGTSSSSSFDIGSAVIGKLTATLNNHDGRFDAYDFTGSYIKVWVGKKLSSGIEWIKRGVYYVDQPDSYAGTIQISALDTMTKFEKPFSDLNLTFPTTVQNMVEKICSHCGVALKTSAIVNGGYRVNENIIESSATCLKVLGYAAQVTGNYARVDVDGNLEVTWYNTSAMERESWLDGGSFDSASPYATGSKADGGNFTDYSSGAPVDGGDFQSNREYHILPYFKSLTVNTDDVVITGIRVTAKNENVQTDPHQGETETYGAEGYILAISGNPLIEYGRAKEVATSLGKRIVGMRFRPFKGSHTSDPSMEAGDPAIVIDRSQNRYQTYLTSVKLTVNGSTDISCSAKSASRNSADNAGAATSAVVRHRNEIERELSNRDGAIKSLGEKLADSSGLYSTTAKQSDGSSIFYMHDKPSVNESKIIYRFTAQAIGISTDGGKTYVTGLSADGDAILNRIYAIGIDADHIISGRISARKGGNYFDLDTGQARFALSSDSTIGGSSIATKDSTMTGSVVQYSTSSSSTEAPAHGWQAVCPERKSGQYIWFRIVSVMQDGIEVASTPSCISGIDGKDGANGSDGKDGKSPTVEVTKVGSVSTVTVCNTDGTTSSVKVNDGIDGTKGANGYVHVKYSNDGGKTFTGNQGELAGSYIGIYTDNTEVDSDNVGTYTWSLIKGANGTDGKDGAAGRGIESSTPEYYLSSSQSSTTDGDWTTSVPAWETGRYYWQRLHIRWDDGSNSYTDGVYNQALTDSVSKAQSALDILNGLDQEKIFNLLTDNGKAKGIFTSNGQLYVNANYIRSGSLDASRVTVKNLSKIGDSSCSLELNSDKIAFKRSDSEVMSIKSSNRTFVCFHESAGLYKGDVLAFNDSQFKKWWGASEASKDYEAAIGDYANLKKFLGSNGDSTYHPSFEVDIVYGGKTYSVKVDTAVGSGTTAFPIKKVINVNPNQSGISSVPVTITFSVRNGLTLGVSVGGATTNVSAGVTDVEVRYSQSGSSVDISTSSGSKVLTTDNLAENIDSINGLFSGTLIIPIVYTDYSNVTTGKSVTYMQLIYRNGLLVSVKAMSSTDTNVVGLGSDWFVRELGK